MLLFFYLDVVKHHQRASFQLISKQIERLSQIERQLLQITDQVLLQNCTSSCTAGTGMNISTSTINNVMSMEELSSTCRMLHSHHAKYLIQLESILNRKYGYEYKYNPKQSQQRYEQHQHGQNEQNNDEKENIENNAIHITTSTCHHVNNRNNNVIINPFIDQPLNRLNRISEGDVETDIDVASQKSNTCTPSFSVSKSSISSTLSLSSSRLRKSLPYIQNDVIVPPPPMEYLAANMEQYQENYNNSNENNNDIHNHSHSISSEEYSKMEDECLNLLSHATSSCDNHNNESQEVSLDLLDDDIEESDNDKELEEEDDDDDDDAHETDASMSMASTVICERKRIEYGMYDEIINQLTMDEQQDQQNHEEHNVKKDMSDTTVVDCKLEEIIEASVKYLSVSHCDDEDDVDDTSTSQYEESDHEHSNNTHLRFRHHNNETHDLSSSILSNVSPTTLNSEFMDASKNIKNNDHNNNMEESVSTKVEELNNTNHGEQNSNESPLDKFKVQILNGGTDVKVILTNHTGIALTTEQTNDKKMNEIPSQNHDYETVTSPLDRFQVQVMNGGSEAKVTPIEIDVLRTNQSPITKMDSPNLQYNNKMRLNNYDRAQSHVDFKVSPQLKETTKVYAKTPMPNIESNNHVDFIVSPQLKETKVYTKTPMPKADAMTHDDLMTPPFKVKKVYAKTPIPAKSSDNECTDASISSYDEEDLINTGSNDQNSCNESNKRVTDPCKTPVLHEDAQNQKNTGTTVRTPLAAAWIQQNMTKDKERLLKVLSGSKAIQPSSTSEIENHTSSSPTNNEQKLDESHQSLCTNEEAKQHIHNANVIKSITQDEYNNSPRVVQMQVTFGELNRAVNVLNQWTNTNQSQCSMNNNDDDNSSSKSLHLEEKEANNLLEKEFQASRKAKSLLMSLCFFRRICLQVGVKNFFIIPQK